MSYAGNFMTGNQRDATGLMKFGLEAIDESAADHRKEGRRSHQLIICEAFQYYDRDGSGFLEREEVREMLMCSGKLIGAEALTDEIFNQIYESFDRDHDGKISYHEFRLGRDEMTDRLVVEAFKHYDFDDSGYLDRDELKEMFSTASKSVNGRPMSDYT
jgi:Ca2+-binding EF-hand superfamily protein